MKSFIDYTFLHIYTLLPAGKRFKGPYVFICITIWIALWLFPLLFIFGFYHTTNSTSETILPSGKLYKELLKLFLAVFLFVYYFMTDKAFRYKDITRQELNANESVKKMALLWLITDIILLTFVCYYYVVNLF